MSRGIKSVLKRSSGIGRLMSKIRIETICKEAEQTKPPTNFSFKRKESRVIVED